MTHRRAFALSQLLAAGALAATSCSGGSGRPAETTTSGGVASITNAWKGPPVDPSRIPLGDGHRSAAAPAVGSVYYCNQPGGVGASEAGPWIHASTWDSTGKVAVQGDVTWAQATFSSTVGNGTRVITTDDLPKGQPTGTFPISSSAPPTSTTRTPTR